MNLLSYFETANELKGGMLVTSSLINKLEIYGFISSIITNYNEFTKLTLQELNFNMNDFIVLSDKIAFRYFQKNEKGEDLYAVFPVFKKIMKNNSSKKLLLKNLYISQLESDDNVNRCLNNSVNKYNKIPLYYTALRKHKLDSKYYNLVGERYGIETLIEDEELYYLTQPYDILMYKKNYYTDDKVSAIGKSFLIVGRSINDVTGEFSYNIFSPEELSTISD